MKIGFLFESDQRVDLTVGQGRQRASGRIDLWRKAHRMLEGFAGRINVYDEDIANASAGKIRRRQDGKVSLDLLEEDDPGEISISLADGGKGVIRALAKEQKRGWGAGEYYMLPVDEADRVVFEPGQRHRKVYVSASAKAMDKAAIAAHAGVSQSSVTTPWLIDHPEYGGSEEMPVTEAVGQLIFTQLIGDSKPSRSDWYLFERGHSYAAVPSTRLMRGESELHPLVIGAWGQGARPQFDSALSFTGYGPKFLVVQGIDLQGFALKDNYCTIIEDYSVVHHESQATSSALITLRNGRHNDCWRLEPVLAIDGEIWEPSANRYGAFYSGGTTGLLIERCLFDHSGWGDGYDYNLSVQYPQPPSGLSHNLYIDYHAFDVTMRDSITARGASFGAMFRGGATVDNVLFLDNNIAFNTLGGNYQGRGPVGQYSTIRDCVCTSSGYKRHAGSVTTSLGTGVNGRSGAYNWGMDTGGRRTSLVGTIICHRANPDDPEEQAAKPTGGMATPKYQSAYCDDSIVYRWNSTDENIAGLTPATLDQTTIQRFTGSVIGQASGTIGDFITYARDPGRAIADVVGDVMGYFRNGFGLGVAPRTTATRCVFLPDPRGDGFRWDNRLNWSTGDRPGTVPGDEVDLDGNPVRFGGLTTDLAALRFGGGQLDVTSGRLTVGEIRDQGRVTIRNSGQFRGQGGTAALTVRAQNGRLNLTGPTADLDLVAAGKAQVLLGPDCRIPAGRSMIVSGGLVRAGWDGTGSARLALEGRLELRSGLFLNVEGGANRYLHEGVRVTGLSSGFTATVGDFEKFAQYKTGADLLWLYDVTGTPEVGETVYYDTLVSEKRNDEGIEPTPVEIRDLTFTIAAIVGADLPEIAPFQSGIHGTIPPAVTADVVLSGSLHLNLAGLGAGRHPLITATISGGFADITVAGLSPDLDAAVAVEPGGVVLTLTAGSGKLLR